METSIAVIGNTGVGKSSLINAIRGLTADDKGAAAVGVIETTTDTASYTHPDHPNVKLWDLPGVGTDRFSWANYLKLIKIDAYDFFVLVSASRFLETDSWLANEISRCGKKFVFVRTKVEVDLERNKKSHPRSHNDDAVINAILSSVKRHLTDAGHSQVEAFLIDSYATDKYDFKRLKDKLLVELPASRSTVTTGRTSCVLL